MYTYGNVRDQFPTVEEPVPAAPKPTSKQLKGPPTLPKKVPPRGQRPKHSELAALFNKNVPLPRKAARILPQTLGKRLRD